MHTSPLQYTILRQTGKALGDFKMIENGDKLMVCLSGGKDSWTLLEMLTLVQKKAPISFSVMGLNIDPGFPGYESHKIQEYCTQHNLEYKQIKADFPDIISKHNTRKNGFCSFCARLRRGMIYSTAKELGITKIALGHHREDFNETLLMNLFFSGQLKAMSPKYTTNDGAHIVIRPLVYVAEKDIITYATNRFPIIDCACDIGKSVNHQRQRMKKLINELEKATPDVKSNMLNALGNIQAKHFPTITK
jgi:tRNA 2-thiocytidine biosynthesis protein TtcA